MKTLCGTCFLIFFTLLTLLTAVRANAGNGDSDSIDGVWQEGPAENRILVTIVQNGGRFTADCAYRHPEFGEIRWEMKGTVSFDGEIRGRLIHTRSPEKWTNQTRVGVLSVDGKLITGRANFDRGGGHDFVWRRLPRAN